ncbi:MAG TPA: DUF2934 domain-containing protein [Candidatus Binatia bacterium]|nr:DUF2934 domain-containing protein [Candidatus Binatia bacterium]
MGSENTKKRRELIASVIERKIRVRARELYDARAEEASTALEDWVRAESEILSGNVLAGAYRKERGNFDASQL